MNASPLNSGVIVPAVTPVNSSGEIDEAAVDRLIDFLLAGRVGCVFVLGTTGEGPSVPRSAKARLVQRTVARVRGRARVYAGIGDTCLADSLASADEYFKAGVDAVVAQPPVYFPIQPQEVLAYFQALLHRVAGPLIIYNIPSTTRVSIPVEVVAQLVGHPRLVGIKDSENNPERLVELLKRFRDTPNFAVSIGVGAFMAEGLKLGAAGIVPSVGNLVPEVCQQLHECIKRGDLAGAERPAERMKSVAAAYQRNRTLGQSLAALKGAMSLLGVCGSDVLPPLLPLSKEELQSLQAEMAQLGLKPK
jgi:dihydrodipicolinate synthase/N-acetylneuraminate lyase